MQLLTTQAPIWHSESAIANAVLHMKNCRQHVIDYTPGWGGGCIASCMACLQKARLLDAKTKSGMYMLEYTVQKPEEDEPRHFLSAVSLGYNGRCYSCCNICPSISAADVKYQGCMCSNLAV